MNDSTGFSKTLTILSLLVLTITTRLIEIKPGNIGMGLLETNLSVCVPHTGWLASATGFAILIMCCMRFAFAKTQLENKYSEHYCNQPDIFIAGERERSHVASKMPEGNYYKQTNYIESFKYFSASRINTPIPFGEFYAVKRIGAEGAEESEYFPVIVHLTDEAHKTFKNSAIWNITFMRLAFLEIMPIILGVFAVIALIFHIALADNYDNCKIQTPENINKIPLQANIPPGN